jgi:UDP-GlcNAc:undecaprenyl-phosphate GlcNAc-1-phosphate transferase
LIGFAYFSFFVTAMLLSMGATWFVRDLAVRKNWVRGADRRRHVHTTGIPRLGGVGLFVAFNISLALLVAGYYLIGRNPIYLTGILAQFWMPALLIFLLGLADDIFDVPVWVKFAVQIAAALMLFTVGLKVNPLIFGGHPLSFAVSLVLTVIWVVGITNAFNLIDGLDGLAAGSALFSTLAVFVIGLIGGNRPVAMITVGLTGAILGFLRFNFNPATIFL